MTTPYLKGAANTHVAFLHKHSTRNPQECKLRLKHQTCYVLHYFKLPPLQLTYFWTWFWQPYPNILFWHSWHIFWPFSLTHSFWPSCKHICWHSIWLILWHLATTSLTTLSGVQHATLNTQYRGWGPARHTELALSRLGSSTPHSTRNIAVGVQHATLNSQYRGWGPARHTELIRSRLGSSTPHWTERMPVAIGVQHATLNWEDPSCHCGPARHTEHRGSQLIEENDEGEEGEEEEEGGEETDIKSNNPHLTGGEFPEVRGTRRWCGRDLVPWLRGRGKKWSGTSLMVGRHPVNSAAWGW